MIRKVIIYTLFSSLLSLSLLGQKSISVSASAKIVHGIAGISYGIDFALVHFDSGKIYYSKILSVFKQRHSIIENLPAGKYYIFYFSNSTIVKSLKDPIHKYFGFFELEEGKNYYLGNFVGRIKIGKNKPLIYTIKDDAVPTKIIKTLNSRKLIEQGEKLIKTYPYQSDSLVIKRFAGLIQHK